MCAVTAPAVPSLAQKAGMGSYDRPHRPLASSAIVDDGVPSADANSTHSDTSSSSPSRSPRGGADSSITETDSDSDGGNADQGSSATLKHYENRLSLDPSIAVQARSLTSTPPVRLGSEVHLHFDSPPKEAVQEARSSPVSQPRDSAKANPGADLAGHREPDVGAAATDDELDAREVAAEARRRNDELGQVLVGTRVSEGHESFVTAYNMLTGIRFAVSKVTGPNNRVLTDADFGTTAEERFDPAGGDSKKDFRFKDYAPWVFRHLRDLFHLDQADYLMSLTAKYIVSELGSPGKSGSFFYYSRDYRFIIKTIRHEEHKQLRRILRGYYQHVRANPDTLISQFYGLHRVRLPFGKKIYFVVMNNVFPALYEIHKKYDLKGSLQGREFQGRTSSVAVYKDLDFLRNHDRLIIGPEKRERLMRQLENDVRFLERSNVMDYSLLVGIHDMAKGNAALDRLLDLCEFGPADGGHATAVKSKEVGPKGKRQERSRHEFAELQKQLSKANPRRLREFDFAEDFRSSFYFYKDHGGMQSTNAENEPRDVIYYIGVIDFLTHYDMRKRIETFVKGLKYKRSEISALPSQEYGARFVKFMSGAIGPEIMPGKRRNQPQTQAKSTASMSAAEAERLAGLRVPEPQFGATDTSAGSSSGKESGAHRPTIQEQPASKATNNIPLPHSQTQIPELVQRPTDTPRNSRATSSLISSVTAAATTESTSDSEVTISHKSRPGRNP